MDVTTTRCCGSALGIHLPSIASLMTEDNVNESMIREAIASVNGHAGRKLNLSRLDGSNVRIQKTGPHVKVTALQSLPAFRSVLKRELQMLCSQIKLEGGIISHGACNNVKTRCMCPNVMVSLILPRYK